MKWKFWKKFWKKNGIISDTKRLNKLISDIASTGMGQAKYSKEKEDFIDQVSEKELERIDQLTVGAKLVCIKNCHEINKTYDNIRDFINNRKKTFYHFNEGETATVNRLANDIAYVDNYSFNLLDYGKVDLQTKKYLDKYIFEVFMLESEYIALQRENQINSILHG